LPKYLTDIRQAGYFVLSNQPVTTQKIRFIVDEPEHNAARKKASRLSGGMGTEDTVLQSAPGRSSTARLDKAKRHPRATTISE